MIGPVLHMAAMGAVTSVLAPAIVLAVRPRRSLRILSLPPGVTLVGFVLLHGGVVLADEDRLDPIGVALHLMLVVGAVAFWLPVLAGPRRLDPAGRAVYLFLAAPSLDLAAVADVARGDSAGGLAMIVAMLPIGIAAVACTWRWISDEQRAELAGAPGTGESLESGGYPPSATDRTEQQLSSDTIVAVCNATRQ